MTSTMTMMTIMMMTSKEGGGIMTVGGGICLWIVLGAMTLMTMAMARSAG